ncbi:MAG: hypothetical protein NTZ19_14155 [Bacteroidetes bacterium]|nr:hypothetical protein [Bacteroidota bacterium]
MKQPIDLLNPLVAEMLKTMETVFRAFEVINCSIKQPVHEQMN